jgi:phospholipid-transporting ATPase
MEELIPGISPTSRLGTILPLAVIMAFTAWKELSEDSKRHNQDYRINTKLVKTLSGQTFCDKKWEDISVGDIVKIENAEFFPADLVLLSSSEPDAICYIETANLDGETNLKIRQGIPETVHFLTPEAISRIHATIKCELPNNSLYTFDATLTMDGKEYPLSPEQMLLRGAQLRNTRWIYGVVVFTGHETKLLMNATQAPVKRTKIELMVNSQMIILFVALLIMSVVCATGNVFRVSNPFEKQILFQGVQVEAVFSKYQYF